VKSGDTLLSSAGRFGVTVKALVTLNDIADPRYIRTGQVLRIP
jgi:LysM repeat protein